MAEETVRSGKVKRGWIEGVQKLDEKGGFSIPVRRVKCELVIIHWTGGEGEMTCCKCTSQLEGIIFIFG